MMTSPLGQQPFRCQIALQGGGAKILALLAAMESVQELQRQGTVKITRVAGTSAGSIVAALFAADIDLGAARQRLIASLTPDLAEAFALPGYTKLAWQLGVRSRHLWDEHRLAEILRRLFEPADVSTLNDVQARRGIAVHILASVLSDARKIVYVSGGADPKPLLPALLDSCAIPFCFRIWQPAVAMPEGEIAGRGTWSITETGMCGTGMRNGQGRWRIVAGTGGTGLRRALCAHGRAGARTQLRGCLPPRVGRVQHGRRRAAVGAAGRRLDRLGVDRRG